MSRKKEKNNWNLVKGSYRLTEPDGFFSLPNTIPLTVLCNETSGEIRLFSKNRTDIIGIEKAFKLSEELEAE